MPEVYYMFLPNVLRCAVVLMGLAGFSAAADTEYIGSLSPNLVPSLPWLAGTMKLAADKDVAMLPTKPSQGSKVYVGNLFAIRKEGVPAMFVHSPDEEYLYVDVNLDGRFEPEERFALPANPNPQHEPAQGLQIRLPHSCAIQETMPVSVQVVAQGAGYMLMNTSRVLASGTVNVEGKERLVQYQVGCSSGTVDPRNGWQGIDANGDGKVDPGVYSPESAAADNETLVFRVGTTYVSTESVDLKSRKVVLRSHPASDYSRIELEVGSTIPDFSFMDATGKPRHLGELRGKYLLLDFWASWCGPCIADMPRVKEVYDHFAGRGFEILGMNGDDEDAIDKATTIIREKGATWPHAIGSEARVLIKKRFRIVPFPTKILLDKEGRIISIGQEGQLPLNGKDLAATLEKCGLHLE